MKKIKIKFVGFWGMWEDYEKLDIYKILSKYYDVDICDDPDYIICSCFSEPYEFLDYPQVRIMLTEENFIPDFNFIDYSICPYPIDYFDRNYCLPVCVQPMCYLGQQNALQIENKTRIYDGDFLNNKEYFCNFIYSHESENGIRGKLFEELSKYKRVESPGAYLNNMDDKKTVHFLENNSKFDFQRKCKFSICVESTLHEGFVTEKITDAFYADTIPIYYGSNTVSDIFNPKAFINVNDFDSIEDAVEFVKRVDNDDELYLSMMNQKVFNDEHYASKVLNGYEEFIKHIFDQPLESAYRRSRVYSPERYENYIRHLRSKNIDSVSVKKIFKTLLNRVNNRIFKR